MSFHLVMASSIGKLPIVYNCCAKWVHKSRWQVRQFFNLSSWMPLQKTSFIFHGSKYLNTCNFSELHIFWKLVFEDEKKLILVQNFTIGFTNRLFLHDLGTICSHNHFEIRALQIQSIVIKESFHQDPILSHFVRPTVSSLDEYQMLVEKIFNIIKVINLEIKVDHT